MDQQIFQHPILTQQMKTIFFISLLFLVYFGSSERLLQETGSTMSYNGLCKKWDEKKLKCMECFQGCTKWENICVKIVKHCAQWDQEGDCILCEQGYGDNDSMPINQTCPAQSSEGMMGIDVNCQCHDDNRTCIDCYAGYYLDLDNICTQFPENCTGADPFGNCTSCVSGYMVENGQCVQMECNLDLCRTYNANQTQCESCPRRAYLEDGCCLQVSGYCSEWVAATGVCTRCYVGYKINKNNNKECIPQSL